LRDCQTCNTRLWILAIPNSLIPQFSNMRRKEERAKASTCLPHEIRPNVAQLNGNTASEALAVNQGPLPTLPFVPIVL
jgi:hypothetical protein